MRSASAYPPYVFHLQVMYQAVFADFHIQCQFEIEGINFSLLSYLTAISGVMESGCDPDTCQGILPGKTMLGQIKKYAAF